MRLVLTALGRTLLALAILEDDEEAPGAGAQVEFGFTPEETYEEPEDRRR